MSKGVFDRSFLKIASKNLLLQSNFSRANVITHLIRDIYKGHLLSHESKIRMNLKSGSKENPLNKIGKLEKPIPFSSLHLPVKINAQR